MSLNATGKWLESRPWRLLCPSDAILCYRFLSRTSLSAPLGELRAPVALEYFVPLYFVTHGRPTTPKTASSFPLSAFFFSPFCFCRCSCLLRFYGFWFCSLALFKDSNKNNVRSQLDQKKKNTKATSRVNRRPLCPPLARK